MSSLCPADAAVQVVVLPVLVPGDQGLGSGASQQWPDVGQAITLCLRPAAGDPAARDVEMADGLAAAAMQLTRQLAALK